MNYLLNKTKIMILAKEDKANLQRITNNLVIILGGH